MKQLYEGLQSLELALEQEFKLIGYPPSNWVLPNRATASASAYDVVIVGAGMAGMAAAYALTRQGIGNIKILDATQEGTEGPWVTYARMKTLRSTKALVGPALQTPLLTFQAWYKAQHGDERWEALYKIPNAQWMEYLCWYRHVLRLPIENEHQVTLIEPVEDSLLIHTSCKGTPGVVHARKVVLATGRGGFGGSKIPNWASALPKEYCRHTCDPIDFSLLKGKRVAIIGAGSSAFDAAAAALESGAATVNLLTRREHIPSVNKAASIVYPGFSQGYYRLPDEARWELFSHIYDQGSPPPFESLDRIRSFQNARVIGKITIKGACIADNTILLDTSQGRLSYDFLILATGFAIDAAKQPELSAIANSIMLWKDRPCAKNKKEDAKQNGFPYLGSHFEMVEKVPGTASYLKHIYCFNYAATMSHCLLSSDIPEISTGASRLALGIASDFFVQNWKDYDKQLINYKSLEFDENNYPQIFHNNSFTKHIKSGMNGMKN